MWKLLYKNHFLKCFVWSLCIPRDRSWGLKNLKIIRLYFHVGYYGTPCINSILIIFSVPFPCPERPRILVQLSPLDIIALYQPQELTIPRSGASFRLLVTTLGTWEWVVNVNVKYCCQPKKNSSEVNNWVLSCCQSTCDWPIVHFHIYIVKWV